MSFFETQLPLSAFGDLRVVELTPIFQGSFEYTVDNTELLTKDSTGSATITQGDGKALLATGTTAGSYAYLKTKTHAKYRAGFGGLYRFTMRDTGGIAYAGIADSLGGDGFNNGYVIGRDGDGVYGFHRFQNGTKVTTPIADWDDPLDGTGPSGITLDNTKLNVFFIQYQYLGVGAQFVWYEDSDTGKMILVHTAPYSNLFTVPSIYNPNFHGVFYVGNGAEAVNYQVESASYGYFLEGKSEDINLHQPDQSSGTVEKTGITTEVPIFTIRNKAIYAGKANFIDCALQRLAASIEASSPNNLAELRVIKNATLTGASWSDINASDSVIEIDTSATAATGGKQVISIPLAGKNDKQIEALVDYFFIGQASDSFTVAASSENSAIVQSSLLWKELF